VGNKSKYQLNMDFLKEIVSKAGELGKSSCQEQKKWT